MPLNLPGGSTLHWALGKIFCVWHHLFRYNFAYIFASTSNQEECFSFLAYQISTADVPLIKILTMENILMFVPIFILPRVLFHQNSSISAQATTTTDASKL